MEHQRDQPTGQIKPPPGRLALLHALDRAAAAGRRHPRSLREGLQFGEWQRRPIEELVAFVGGIDAFEALDANALPVDEPFDASHIDDDDIPAVASVLVALHEHRPAFVALLKPEQQSVVPSWLEGEYVTVVHRLIAQSARTGTTEWHREPRRTAAAFVWIALAGNLALGRRGHVLTAADVWRWYEVGDSRALARRLCEASGIRVIATRGESEPRTYPVPAVLGDARLLHSSFRSFLLAQAAQWQRTLADDEQRSNQRRPVRFLDESRIMLRARQLQPIWSFKVLGETGRASVMLAFGIATDDDDYELIGMSIPEAHELVRQLREALDGPIYDGQRPGDVERAS